MTTFNKIYRASRVWVLILLAALVPVMINNKYFLNLACLGMMYAMLTISLNILSGFSGLMSVGHIAFFGLGAYTTAILTTTYHMPILVGFLAAGIVAAFFSLLLGLPTMRLQGTYFCVATLAFGTVVYQVLKNWESLTNGTKGILGIPAIEIFGISFKNYKAYYYLMLIALILSVIIAMNLLHSRPGRAILAIRESDIAAEAMGINVVNYKIIAFMTSAFIAGIAGAFYAHFIRYISPEPFAQAESNTLLSMMVIGGIGSIPGAILGGIALTILPEVLRFIGDFRLVLYGAAVVAIIIFAPGGLGGFIEKWDRHLCGYDKLAAARKAEMDAEIQAEIEASLHEEGAHQDVSNT